MICLCLCDSHMLFLQRASMLPQNRNQNQKYVCMEARKEPHTHTNTQELSWSYYLGLWCSQVKLYQMLCKWSLDDWISHCLIKPHKDTMRQLFASVNETCIYCIFFVELYFGMCVLAHISVCCRFPPFMCQIKHVQPSSIHIKASIHTPSVPDTRPHNVWFILLLVWNVSVVLCSP